ncbi:MAG: CMD domain protein, partial [Mycetocola sp.]
MSAPQGSTLIDDLIGHNGEPIRSPRPTVRDNLNEVVDALFSPVAGDAAFPVADRLIVALYVATLHGDSAAIGWFAEAAEAAGVAKGIEDETIELAEAHLTTGPYGSYDGPLRGESVDGPAVEVPRASVFGIKLGAGLEHAHRVLFHPRDVVSDHLRALSDAGWSTDQIVILTQLVSVLTFQLRIAQGVRAISDVAATPDAHQPRPALSRPQPGTPPPPLSATSGQTPERFTRLTVAWSPWLTVPLDTDDHIDWVGTFGKRRASSPSFRLAARDPRVSLPLSRTEDNIFGGSDGGLSRGERELGALLVSRLNGCIYCASVHSRATTKFTGDVDRVDAILDSGIGIDLGERWNVLADAVTAL